MISSIINRYCNALLSVLTMIYSPIYPIIPIRTFREKDNLKKRNFLFLDEEAEGLFEARKGGHVSVLIEEKVLTKTFYLLKFFFYRKVIKEIYLIS